MRKVINKSPSLAILLLRVKKTKWIWIFRSKKQQQRSPAKNSKLWGSPELELTVFPALGVEHLAFSAMYTFKDLSINARIYRFVYTCTNLNTLANVITHLHICTCLQIWYTVTQLSTHTHTKDISISVVALTLLTTSRLCNRMAKQAIKMRLLKTADYVLNIMLLLTHSNNIILRFAFKFGILRLFMHVNSMQFAYN